MHLLYYKNIVITIITTPLLRWVILTTHKINKLSSTNNYFRPYNSYISCNYNSIYFIQSNFTHIIILAHVKTNMISWQRLSERMETLPHKESKLKRVTCGIGKRARCAHTLGGSWLKISEVNKSGRKMEFKGYDMLMKREVWSGHTCGRGSHTYVRNQWEINSKGELEGDGNPCMFMCMSINKGWGQLSHDGKFENWEEY